MFCTGKILKINKIITSENNQLKSTRKNQTLQENLRIRGTPKINNKKTYIQQQNLLRFV